MSPENPARINSHLTRNLGLDYEALKNDLAQATAFAGELQNEIAVNKNDAAHFKKLFEKASEDLERLQSSILALRQERHDLANEAMKAAAFEAKLTSVNQERDALLEAARRVEQTAQNAIATLRKRDAQVADLTMQVMLLKNGYKSADELRVSELAAKNAEAVFLERFER